MSNCTSACKQIVMMCEQARMKGKRVIRISKIEDIADNAVKADLEDISNTKTNGNRITWSDKIED